MKRKISLLLAILMILLAGCGSAGDSKRAISANDLKQALIKADYEVEEAPMDSADVEEELGVHNVSSATGLSFYKLEENGGVEQYGFAFIFQCDNEKDAVSAYNEIDAMNVSEGMYFEEVKRSYGKKSTYEDADNPDFGAVYFVVQVENTVVIAMEEWDVDGNGAYDYELNNILESLGY